MSPPQGKNVVFRCSDLGPTYLVCHFYKTDYSISQYQNLSNFLICPLKTSKEEAVLVGVLSKVHKYSLSCYEPVVHLKFELVEDDSKTLRRKITQWFIENPKEITFDFYY
ncbi:uncharacterized protein LOC141531738 [Cotesia typhae]|uniref:uncharacterized protein LOC141531738 n=1 Tax=Cotesia typhae TaxID=2053667 RepID=UPI003D69A04F